MILPLIVPLLKGEYLYSYMLRIAKVNGIDDLDAFIRAYVFPGMNQHLSNFEMSHYLNAFFDALLIPNDRRADMIRVSTIYPALAVWMSEGQKAHLVGSMAYCPNEYPHLLSPMKPHETNLKFCPKCMEEDMDRYGFTYARRVHQIPGVRVCTKHQVPLVKMNLKTTETELFDLSNEHDLAYAKICERMLDLPSNKNLLTDAIGDLLNQINLSKLMTLQNGYPYPSSMNILEMLKRKNDNYLNFEKMTSLLLCLIEKFHFVIPTMKTMNVELPFGYEMLNGDDKIATFRHDVCNTVFFATPYALNAGWGCPQCDSLDERRKFEKLVENSGHPMVKLITPFESLQKRVAMKCMNCGKIFYIKPGDFLENNSRCRCQTHIHAMTKTEAKELVEKDNHYKLLKFSGAYEDMKVRCLDCNHTFLVKPDEFKKRPFCRKCTELKRNKKFDEVRANNRNLTAAAIKKYVKEMTGDAFEVIKVDHHCLTLKCNHCQKIFQLTYEQFKRGKRCDCYKYPCGEDFINYVDSVTSHEYKVERTAYSRYLVTNVKTGYSIRLTKLEIMAELMRPGQSDKIPISHKGTYSLKIKDKIYKCISHFLDDHYAYGDEFRACDVVIDGLSAHSIRNSLSSTMIDKHIVSKKKTGVYIYMGKESA